jgi:hypothetical protein
MFPSAAIRFYKTYYSDNLVMEKYIIKQYIILHEAARSKLSSSSFTRQSLEIPLSGKS